MTDRLSREEILWLLYRACYLHIDLAASTLTLVDWIPPTGSASSPAPTPITSKTPLKSPEMTMPWKKPAKYKSN